MGKSLEQEPIFMNSMSENGTSDTAFQAKLADFLELAKSRRSVRNFLPDPIPPALLEQILEATRWAPSGYNLQPTHMVLVDDPKLKLSLMQACLGQRQVLEAPVTVVFTGDRNVAQNNLDRMIQAERELGTMDDRYERILRKFVSLGFDVGPVGLGWLWKSTIPPWMTHVRPIPSIPAVHRRYWLAKQVSLSAMVFMLAAHAAGLATVPMEGFDEQWVRKLLNIPRSHIIPIVVPVGYAASSELKKSRLPLNTMVHRNTW